MSLFDKRRLLMDSAAAEQDPFAGERGRLERLAAQAQGDVARRIEVPDELGAFGGVADIPGPLYAQQQWSGNQFAVGGLPNVPLNRGNLIRINLPLKYARDWTIQLAAPSVPSGAPVAFPSTITTAAGLFGAPANIVPGVQLTWGHHGATETVIMDWPQLGGSITVHGSFVEVSISDPGDAANGRLANYVAWCSEGSAARAGLPAFQPVRTHQVGTLGPTASSGILPLVPRTRAWSLFGRQVTTTPIFLPLEVDFFDNAAAIRGQYVITDDSSGAFQTFFEAAQPRPIPIHSNAFQLVNRDNNVGHDWVDLSMTMWLDVGS